MASAGSNPPLLAAHRPKPPRSNYVRLSPEQVLEAGAIGTLEEPDHQPGWRRHRALPAVVFATVLISAGVVLACVPPIRSRATTGVGATVGFQETNEAPQTPSFWLETRTVAASKDSGDDSNTNSSSSNSSSSSVSNEVGGVNETDAAGAGFGLVVTDPSSSTNSESATTSVAANSSAQQLPSVLATDGVVFTPEGAAFQTDEVLGSIRAAVGAGAPATILATAPLAASEEPPLGPTPVSSLQANSPAAEVDDATSTSTEAAGLGDGLSEGPGKASGDSEQKDSQEEEKDDFGEDSFLEPSAAAQEAAEEGGPLEVASSQAPFSCGLVEENMDYWTTLPTLYEVPHTLSIGACIKHCMDEWRCSVWAWGSVPGVPFLSHVCFLKELEQGEQPIRMQKHGIVSGSRDCEGTETDAAFSTHPVRHPHASPHALLPKESEQLEQGPADETATSPGLLRCGVIEPDVDYWTTLPTVKAIPHVPSALACSLACVRERRCVIWTWGSAKGVPFLSQVCFLKDLEEEERVTRVDKIGVISGGLPCKSSTTAPPLMPRLPFEDGNTGDREPGGSTLEPGDSTLEPGDTTPGDTTPEVGGGTQSVAPEHELGNESTVSVPAITTTVTSATFTEETNTSMQTSTTAARLRSVATAARSNTNSTSEADITTATTTTTSSNNPNITSTAGILDSTSSTSSTTSSSTSSTSSTSSASGHVGPDSTCGIVEEGVDYWTKHPAIARAPHVHSGEQCSQLCVATPACDLWTWDGNAHNCFVQRLEPRERPSRKRRRGYVSGFLPCAGQASLSTSLASLTSLTSSPSLRGTGGTSDDQGSLAPSTTPVPASLPPADTMQGAVPCGLVETNIDYWTRLPAVDKVSGVRTAEECRRLCFDQPRCMAWSLNIWKRVCFLTELEQDEQPKRRTARGFVSGGLPCNQQELQPAGTLFCFALMQPVGYERALLAMQHRQKASLFACDEFAIYSNRAIEVVPGVVTRVVNSTLKCAVGGEFMTALNLDIFVTVWKKVVSDGTYLLHDWTIKVDPDCVFFPDLLKAVLPHHPEAPEGTYLNNCKYGLHGPIEVFSRNAVKSWYNGIDTCQRHFAELCSGFCGWGEDLYIDQCLWKVLKARRDNEWGLLTEDHCPMDPAHVPQWNASLCANGDISFHPFKKEETYMECMIIAMRSPIVDPGLKLTA